MIYTIKIQYKGGNILTWKTTDLSLVQFILKTEDSRYGKQIIRAVVKGERT